MRVSINENDPGYRDDCFLYMPYLNGQPIPNCVTMDDEEKYVIRYQSESETEILTEKVFCDVEIRKRLDNGKYVAIRDNENLQMQKM